MAIDTAHPRSRRAVLAAAFGAASAIGASVIGRPATALAGSDGDVVLGATNTADTTTRINYNGAGTAFRTASTSGVGVHGDSNKNYGVVGTSYYSHGVYATSVAKAAVRGEGGAAGVEGITTSDGAAGVYGEASGPFGTGVSGHAAYNADSIGVYGYSPAGTGVVGQTKNGISVDGDSWTFAGAATGVRGRSQYGIGIDGISHTTTAVRGTSASGFGVQGKSTSNVAMFGQSSADVGVYGLTYSQTKPAVLGWSFKGNTAIQGYSGGNAVPDSSDETGVSGVADAGPTSVGVRGTSPTGRGGVFSGSLAQIRLVASSAATHPAAGTVGDIFLDKSARLWLCIKGGNPATWKRVQLV